MIQTVEMKRDTKIGEERNLMAVRTILQSAISGGTKEEDTFLHTQVKQVEKITSDIQQIIIDLRDTLWAYPFSVGLSAPQIGIPYAISVINPNLELRDEDQIIINPSIINLSVHNRYSFGM